MSISNAVILFIIIILVYWSISEVFTVLFRFTGLPYDKARFQVLSLLTGTGFTTRESENLVSIRPRRKLAQVTMLFGYVFNITIISTFINIFVSVKKSQVDDLFGEILIPMGVILVMLIISRIKTVHRFIDQMIEKLAGKIMHKDEVNTILLIDYISQDSIAKVRLKEVPEEFKGKALAELDLRTKYNVLVMLVERADHTVVPADGNTVFCEGDKLTMFGNYKVMTNMFHATEMFN